MNDTCPECAGSCGELVTAHELLDMMPCEAYLTAEKDTAWLVCPRCSGTGSVRSRCEECGGSGVAKGDPRHP